GKRVHAVVAGHMHHRLKGGGLPRRVQLLRDHTLYLNAARVPRIRVQDGAEVRYHVSLTLGAQDARATEIWVPTPK
ncbi:MAG TPA: hypothetical protein VHE37_00480, partial [Nevskiaceae bacterium]|nr:hypothetical protein [Nevskiaceae bacterium]